MRKNFINVLRLFNDTEHLIDEVYSGIAKDFAKNDDALHYIAERPLAHFELSSKQPTASAIAKATHNYQQVLKSHHSAGLLEYYMVFVETSSHIMDDATKAKVKVFVDSLTLDNVTSYPINEACAILLIKFLIEANATRQAVQYAFKLVNEHPTISKSNGVWTLLFGFLNKLRESASSMCKYYLLVCHRSKCVLQLGRIPRWLSLTRIWPAYTELRWNPWINPRLRLSGTLTWLSALKLRCLSKSFRPSSKYVKSYTVTYLELS